MILNIQTNCLLCDCTSDNDIMAYIPLFYNKLCSILTPNHRLDCPWVRDMSKYDSYCHRTILSATNHDMSNEYLTRISTRSPIS